VLESLLAALVVLRAVMPSVTASSSMASEANRRRTGATAPATSKTAHWSPEKFGVLLMHEATKMASTNVARNRRTSIKGNRQIASHLTLQSGDLFTSLSL
jgi:hypothetical protein